MISKPCTTRQIKDWLDAEKASAGLKVKEILFSDSEEWSSDIDNLFTHRSNRFFDIVGVKYQSPFHREKQTQPIIKQTEIGLLAFGVHQDEAGEWWILAHAKVEPGNINEIQLSPTVQATKSNYEIAHGGEPTHYLSEILSADKLYDELQSEQNSRFLGKLNRNRVSRFREKIRSAASFYKWVPLKEYLPMLAHENMVNTDARSVLCCWLLTDLDVLAKVYPQESAMNRNILQSLQSGSALHSNEAIASWVNGLNQKYQAPTEEIKLADLEPHWIRSQEKISSAGHPDLSVYQIQISCNSREVKQWDQPILGSEVITDQTLILSEIDGTLHILAQAVFEAGNKHGAELTTSIQNYHGKMTNLEAELTRVVRKSGRNLISVENSEEGGRFDKCCSRYQLVLLDSADLSLENEFYKWVSLSQIPSLLRKSNMLTNEIRSALSALLAFRGDQ